MRKMMRWMLYCIVLNEMRIRMNERQFLNRNEQTTRDLFRIHYISIIVNDL